jgi:hypothetical protein
MLTTVLLNKSKRGIEYPTVQFGDIIFGCIEEA